MAAVTTCGDFGAEENIWNSSTVIPASCENWPASYETCMQVRKQQLKLDMEQQTGSK